MSMMNKTLVQTRFSAYEFRFVEVFLDEQGFSNFDIRVSSDFLLSILFNTRIDALMFNLKCLEDIYYETSFYFEPDIDFEVDLEKACGTYSQFDDVNRRTQG